MTGFPKVTWVSIVLFAMFLAVGALSYQWWQKNGELVKQIELNENLRKQVSELQKEIEKLKEQKGGELAKQIKQNENLMGQVEELQKQIQELKTSQIIKGEITEDKNLEVSIRTDKREYRQGEIVSYTVKNMEDHPIWFPPYLIIEKKLTTGEIEGYSTLPCLDPGHVREAPVPIKMESKSEYNSSWNQIFCNKLITKNVIPSPGIYRIRFLYSEERSIEFPKSAYSNEFTIKN